MLVRIWFVANGIFKAELNEFLTRELAEDGYSGVEVRVTPTRTEIIILATRTQNVLGEKGRRIRVDCCSPEERAKSMKFVDGLMIHSGDPVNYYVDTAVCHVLLRQGVLGIKVKIMLPQAWDPSSKTGPKKPLRDHVSIVEPKDEILPATPISEQKGGKPEPPAMPQPVPTA
ncbi:hypothetical protein A6R68_00180 [Neotoma lepida]|uniref:DNA-(apurinic or apyrimidinic site) lyase n=1 Tax=Neotoma lepida TaxID=56216 RepID=A0A1A6H159_NEOLE|nr:hypothetical protein A6R68_00180 [Neotoma lepida]